MRVKFYILLVSVVLFTFVVRLLSNYRYEKILGSVETEEFSLTVGVHKSIQCDNGVLLKYSPEDISGEDVILNCVSLKQVDELQQLLEDAKQEIIKHQ